MNEPGQHLDGWREDPLPVPSTSRVAEKRRRRVTLRRTTIITSEDGRGGHLMPSSRLTEVLRAIHYRGAR